ncbi:hypothetical protein Tco_0607877 [Tanacetum coccineum]
MVPAGTARESDFGREVLAEMRLRFVAAEARRPNKFTVIRISMNQLVNMLNISSVLITLWCWRLRSWTRKPCKKCSRGHAKEEEKVKKLEVTMHQLENPHLACGSVALLNEKSIRRSYMHIGREKSNLDEDPQGKAIDATRYRGMIVSHMYLIASRPDLVFVIGKCNVRIDPEKTQKEPTYQVVLDTLALTTCYPAFLITASVPVIYMQQLWATVNKHDLSYRFKIEKKEFDEPLSEEDIRFFIKELGHTRNIRNITNMVVHHMHQPWRTFAAIINKCLNDSILSTLRFVSKDEDYQVYGALIPAVMTNTKIRDSPAYQTYLAFATGAATPKPKRIYKKHDSPMIKTTTTSPEETVDPNE